MHRRHLLLAPAALPLPARAQTDPLRAVHLIVPYGAGNITDQVARVLVDELARRWGGRLVVDNQPGAGGVVGVVQLVRAPADGSTLGTVSVAALAIVPHITRQPRYDPLTDLTPIAGIAVSSSFLAVHASLPVRTLSELAAYCRARPAESPVFYYSPGNATVPHLNLETIRRALDFPMQHVPYRTSAAGNTDLLANRVQVTMDSFSITRPHMQSGVLRPIALNGTARHPEFPDIPTFAEALPGVRLLNAWTGLFGPRGLVSAIVERASRDVLAIQADPAFVARLPLGTSPFVHGPAELAAYMRADHERLGRLVQEIGLQAD